jgi:hypothetical protein
VRVAALLNPANATVTETTLRDVQQAARTTGLQLRILNATTIGEIDAAFVTLGRERPEALFVAGDTFFAVAASNSPPWRHAPEFRQLIRCVSLWKWAG